MKKIIYSFFLVFGLSAIISGCTERFEEMNIDPNNPSDVATPFLLTNAQKEIMDWYWDEWLNGRQGMQYAQYWASNQYTSESRYQERPEVNNNAWSAFYAIGLADLQEIIRLVTESPEEFAAFGDPENQIAVARILQIWTFQVMTDIWGDIPYFQALSPDEFIAPEFDPQSEIYPAMLEDLNEAIALIDVNEPGFVSGDVIYGGDMGQWLRFANSLKLRIAIRMADRNEDLAGTAIQQAVASGVFTSNEDNALFYYVAALPNANPLYEDRLERQDFAVSAPLVNTLLALDDPRLLAYAEPNIVGEFVGMPYGITESEAGDIDPNAVSQPSGADDLSSGILAATFPGIYMNYSEVEFILAEAAARGIGGINNAAAHYRAGVRASMNFWGISGDVVDSYLNAHPFNAANWRQSIGVQKWIALYGQGLQGWIEFRRLEFDGVLVRAAEPIVQLSTPAGVPVRTLYPTREAQVNTENYREAVEQMGGDNLGTRVWWDVQ